MGESREKDVVYDELPIPAMSNEIWDLILNRSKIPETMVHMMKGEIWEVSQTESGLEGKWVEKGEPFMNEKGIRFFTPLLYSAVTPDKLATFITDDEVSRMMKEMMEAIIEVVMECGDEFAIPAAKRNFVCRMLEHFYFLSLTASRKGTILAALKPMYERKEIYTQAPKGGIKLPSFLGGRSQ